MSRTHVAASSRAVGQRGITLIIVMLILVVVTILGIGGAQIALMGERSTRYDRDYLIASQAAEAALLDAEIDIGGPGGMRTASFVPGAHVGPGCGSSGAASAPDRGLCAPAVENGKPTWTTVDFLDTSATAPSVAFGTFTNRQFANATQGGPSGIKPALPPRYVIEFVPDTGYGNNAVSVPTMYRITAIGFGPRQDVQVVMQTLYRKFVP